MASTKTLNAANLEMLGAPRLAELLIELSTGSAAAKRKLRLELAGTAGADEAAHAIGKRLASIAKSRSFIDWQKAKTFVADLDTQRRAILDHVAPADPRGALALLWRLVLCSNPVFNRTSDSSGRIREIFQTACRDLAPLASAAKAMPTALADSLFEALQDNDFGQYDVLIGLLAPNLGRAGLEHLRARTMAWRSELTPEPARKELPSPIDAYRRKRLAGAILQQVADALGDVDGYIAAYDAKESAIPQVAARIATRLLRDARPEDAMRALEQANPIPATADTEDWDRARIAALEALGRVDEAQAHRWQIFATRLHGEHLRAYLRALPEFEDFDAEQRAIAHAADFPNLHRALAFLVEWPALDRASRLVLDRTDELNGDAFELLASAADSLEAKYPLAAVLLRRAMIDFTLRHGRASRYKHAARHVAECAHLDARIDEYRGWPDHETYMDALHAAYHRKWTFWEELGAPYA